MLQLLRSNGAHDFKQNNLVQKEPLLKACLDLLLYDPFEWGRPRTTDTEWRHKSKKSENLGRWGRQNMLRPYLKIWEWERIFGRAVKAISVVREADCCQTDTHVDLLSHYLSMTLSCLLQTPLLPLLPSWCARRLNSLNPISNNKQTTTNIHFMNNISLVSWLCVKQQRLTHVALEYMALCLLRAPPVPGPLPSHAPAAPPALSGLTLH